MPMLSVKQLEDWIAYDMIQPLTATTLDQMRAAMVHWHQAPPAPGDGPLDFKEAAIWKMEPQARALINGAPNEELREQYRRDYEEWKDAINALEAPI